MRERLAFVTNEELKREGQYPRYDPRSYDQMGIKAEPGEHLGTKLSAAEGKGDVSERSIANEAKQWAAIQRQLDDQREAGNEQVSVATAARKRRLEAADLADGERTALADAIAELDALERSVVDVDYEIAEAQHLTARACSRASKIQGVNERWLDADEAGTCELSPRLRRERVSLRTAASDYLGRLEPLRGAAADIISICDAVRASTLARKRSLERAIETRLTDAAARAARMPTWLAQLDRKRPLIIKTGDGYNLTGVQGAEALALTDAGQLALAPRYARQEREVDALIKAVGEGRRDLVRRGGRWLFDHDDPAVVALFARLQDHPRVGEAIDRAISPPGSVDAPMRRPDHRYPAASIPPPMLRSDISKPPPHRATGASSTGEGPGPAGPNAPAPHQPSARMVPAATIAPSSAPQGQPASPSMNIVLGNTTVRTPAKADPLPTAREEVGPTPATSERDGKVGIPATSAIDGAPTIRDSRIDSMALALKGMKVDPPSISRTVTAEKPPVSQTPQSAAPATTAKGSSSPAPMLPATPPIPAMTLVHSVQRIVEEKIVLRLDSNGEIDARALVRQGITIADADRRNPRLVGRAQEQRRHARQVVETFVTKHPEFIVEANDVCSLSPKTKPDVLEFFENHDGPGMQAMLRRVFDQHQAAERSRVARDAATSLTHVAADQVAIPPAMTTLERDPAMIAAAQARLREQERERANAAARLAAAKHPAKDIAPEKSDGPAGPPTPSTPGPKRPPPGWDGGFGR